MKISITAIIKSKPDTIEEVKLYLTEMAIHSKKEKACIQYDLHHDKENLRNFLFHEIWQDEESLALHNVQPYVRSFINKVPEILSEPVLIYKTEMIA